MVARRKRALIRYRDFVHAGVDLPSVWKGLRHQIYLASEQFIERTQESALSTADLTEIPRVQRRAAAKPLDDYVMAFSDQREGMARAYLSGAYTMKVIAERFGVHYSTVSRAIRAFELKHDKT